MFITLRSVLQAPTISSFFHAETAFLLLSRPDFPAGLINLYISFYYSIFHFYSLSPHVWCLSPLRVLICQHKPLVLKHTGGGWRVSLIVDLCRQVIKIFYYRSQTDYALNELLMTIIIPMFFSEYLES